MTRGRALRVVVDARPLDIGFLRDQGIGRFADALVAQLAPVAAERGGELVLLRQKSGEASVYAGGAAATRSPAATVVRVRRPPVPQRLADLAEQVLLPVNLRRARADLVHSLSIYRAAVYPGVPAVMTIHDVIPLMWPEQYLRTGAVHRMLYRAARRARRLIAVSERAKEDAVGHLGVDAERIDVVHEAAGEGFVPTDPGQVPARLGIEPPYVLYVGGLANVDPRKDVEGLIGAFAGWARERSRPEALVLAGRLGPAGRPLVERAEASGARIVFTDFVPDPDLPALYSGASCLVTASRYEGFGLPALESIACGTPVAAYDAGALREVAGPGAILVRTGDASELMRAVEMLCDQAQLRSRLAAKGLEHAKGFSWRRAAEQTWDTYERAVASA